MSRTRKVVVAALIGATALASTLGITIASAKTTSHPWESMDGLFKTKAAANSQIAKLKAKGFTGYSSETEKTTKSGKTTTRYEVEKQFSTKKAAQTEVNKLHTKGFKGASVESSAGTP